MGSLEIDDSSNACIEVLETLSVPETSTDTAQGSTAITSGAKLPAPAVSKVSAYPDIDVGHIVEVKGGLSEFDFDQRFFVLCE